MRVGTPIDWSEIRPAFEFDGTLRDIYVRATTAEDWQAVWEFLRSAGIVLRYEVGGADAALPDDVKQLLDIEGAPHLLSIELGGMLINCHFYGASEIEFDLDPREVTGAETAEQLFRFMHGLSRATGKDTLLADENHPSNEYLRISPSGRIALNLPLR